MSALLSPSAGPKLAALFLFSSAVLLGACSDTATNVAAGSSEPLPLPSDPADYKPLRGYTAMDIPADNAMSVEKAHLGRQLFFDARLSGDGKLSCYSCHLNDKGLSDGRETAVGAFAKKLTRNSPTLWNIGYHSRYYWDGRARSLEAQALAAWKGGNMGARQPEAIVETLAGIDGYREQFQAVFGGPPSPDLVTKALACYMRTIISRDTAWDRYLAGDRSAVSEAAVRGEAAFRKAKCDNCHSGRLFTDQQFHNVGIGMKKDNPDIGHAKVSGKEKHTGAFKTPTLRDVAESGPYFHDGSVKELRTAVQLMLMGGMPNPHLEGPELLQKRDLSGKELDDLIEFLEALSEPSKLDAPSLP